MPYVAPAGARNETSQTQADPEAYLAFRGTFDSPAAEQEQPPRQFRPKLEETLGSHSLVVSQARAALAPPNLVN